MAHNELSPKSSDKSPEIPEDRVEQLLWALLQYCQASLAEWDAIRQIFQSLAETNNPTTS